MTDSGETPLGEIKSIVSSEHLSNNHVASLSEVEFGLIIAGSAFNRWMVHCMSAAGVDDLGGLDVLVLHTINHRKKPKKLADICLVLHIEDTYTATYAIKKLEKQKLVFSTKKGKEKYIEITQKGAEMCDKYRQVREACLLPSMDATGKSNEELADIAATLRVLSGLYDQAARSAASL
ncbi:MAG: winged helix DNA-binding protein [Alphaproteobacteria bacterium]|nr:winged helix DNA-binding protein [Alphaproteobacteria bacterium]